MEQTVTMAKQIGRVITIRGQVVEVHYPQDPPSIHEVLELKTDSTVKRTCSHIFS